MSLAAMGCNPDVRWENVTDPQAVTIGTIGYSPPHGLFVCVQANGAIGANFLCGIEPGWQAQQGDDADITKGVSLGASTAAFADDEYGWLQVWGLAEVTANGTVSAGGVLQLDGAEEGEVVAGTAASPEILGAHAVDALSNGNVGTVQLLFPVYRAA